VFQSAIEAGAPKTRGKRLLPTALFLPKVLWPTYATNGNNFSNFGRGPSNYMSRKVSSNWSLLFRRKSVENGRRAITKAHHEHVQLMAVFRHKCHNLIMLHVCTPKHCLRLVAEDQFSSLFIEHRRQKYSSKTIVRM